MADQPPAGRPGWRLLAGLYPFAAGRGGEPVLPVAGHRLGRPAVLRQFMPLSAASFSVRPWLEARRPPADGGPERHGLASLRRRFHHGLHRYTSPPRPVCGALWRSRPTGLFTAYGLSASSRLPDRGGGVRTVELWPAPLAALAANLRDAASPSGWPPAGSDPAALSPWGGPGLILPCRCPLPLYLLPSACGSGSHLVANGDLATSSSVAIMALLAIRVFEIAARLRPPPRRRARFFATTALLPSALRDAAGWSAQLAASCGAGGHRALLWFSAL